MKKYAAEFIGTMVLVFFGCGSAIFGGGALGILGIALAFGLSIVAMAYSIGRVSGCHVNPAVSLACLIDGRLSPVDFVGYVVAQILGAFAGSGLIELVKKGGFLPTEFTSFGSNNFGEGQMIGAIVVEIILTFVFILLILSVTSDDKVSNHAGLIIGATLTFVHIIGINLTGTSVNPARSLAPAVFEKLADGESTALGNVWVFIAAPLIGAAIAAVVYSVLIKNKKAK